LGPARVLQSRYNRIVRVRRRPAGRARRNSSSWWASRDWCRVPAMSLLAEGPRKAHRRAGMPIVDQKGATVKSFATGVIKLLTMRYEESVAVVDTILSNINHLDNFVGKLPG